MKKSWFKKLFHVHKFTTLIIYEPHNKSCSLPQCQNNDDYGFLLQCSVPQCGHHKLTKLPYSIKEVVWVKEKNHEKREEGL